MIDNYSSYIIKVFCHSDRAIELGKNRGRSASFCFVAASVEEKRTVFR